ncbi:cache domain-containing protein [Pseudoduganella sp. OTU4001]|uniref:cache domain-containing protein n=1 Tax=Pseudoduganella sp. OTU4001 TaxID=3043854 RepID=UPI00313EE98C
MFVRNCLLIALMSVAPIVSAADVVTKPEAEAMVKKALGYMKTNGREKTFAEIDKKDGQFVDRDLYLVVYGTDGVVRAHGGNAKMIGKNLMELKDVDGKAFVKERVEMAKKKVPFWQDYKFNNPTTNKIEPKTMYCVPEEDLIVCGGVYLK